MACCFPGKPPLSESTLAFASCRPVSQEDPYKLVVLAKDYYPIPVTCADLFFADGRASIISCDEEGVLRVNEYDPHGEQATSDVLAGVLTLRN